MAPECSEIELRSSALRAAQRDVGREAQPDGGMPVVRQQQPEHANQDHLRQLRRHVAGINRRALGGDCRCCRPPQALWTGKDGPLSPLQEKSVAAQHLCSKLGACVSLRSRFRFLKLRVDERICAKEKNNNKTLRKKGGRGQDTKETVC